VRKLELPHAEQNTTLLELILEVDHQSQRVVRHDAPSIGRWQAHRNTILGYQRDQPSTNPPSSPADSFTSTSEAEQRKNEKMS
jgi:hypothetical protein